MKGADKKTAAATFGGINIGITWGLVKDHGPFFGSPLQYGLFDLRYSEGDHDLD